MATVKNKKVEVLDTADLQAVKEHVNKQTELLVEVGRVEVHKAGVISEYSQVITSFTKLRQELELKYGKVSIDTITGEYKTIEDNGDVN